MNTISQNLKIKAHLEDGKTITPLEAIFNFGIERLASRVHDLKNKSQYGQMPIITTMVKGNGKRFASYSLPKADA